MDNTTHHRAARRPGSLLPRRAALTLFALLGAAVALLSARYFTGDPETFLEDQRATYLAHLTPLLLHIGGGTAALLLGPLQFAARLRARRPAVHRFVGRAYLLSVAVTGVGGLVLAPHGLFPPIAPIGFGVLGVLLLGSSAAALQTARQRRFDRHRVWAVRSYALILAAVTLRVWLPLFDALGAPFDQAYAAAGWTCWLINLAVAEAFLQRRPAPVRAA
ncbi:DUF2306 domain-containing protein [Kitasatospora sp. NPDC096147]|uniref:DUF2306 domain-containing protein n=1 Tax=Kitasatospora sp. NPDC096147 TaxID=3364093 RepID=UPI003812C2BF